IVAEPVTRALSAQAVDQIRGILARKHRFSPKDERAVRIFSREQFRPIIDGITIGIQALLALIGALTLGIGGVGVMNIMLVSVTERTREIGIRMAVGAKRRNILSQFLLEAMFLSLVGGLIGVVAGIIGSDMVGDANNWKIVLSVEAIVLAFSCSALVGIFFGFYPAWKASKLNPIEALRYE
ncbi:MAG TPA: FtsX-like permease family protein, partial [Chthonomonadales bacterium]|nr:FtsX-like permease family protein [Chthonomonadales bacterium]